MNYRATASLLFGMLRKVAENSAVNGMTPEMLSENLEEPLRMPKRQIEFIIENYAQVFDEEVNYLVKKGRIVLRKITMQDLIVKILDKYYRVVESGFFEIILSTHHYFVSPTEFLEKLIHFYISNNAHTKQSQVIRIKFE